MAPSEEIIKTMIEEKIEFVKRCGLKLVEIKPGYVKCLMPAKGNENHIGSMYAGALFTLAEIPGGALWMSNFDISKSYPILKSFHIDYLKPAKGDIEFETGLSADRIRQLSELCELEGKAEFLLEGKLTDKQGTIVAKSTGTYQLRKI